MLNEAVVQKKWGYEYLAYRNSHLAIWYLFIAHKQSTSLHCHCNKNTGLILLDGIATVSFLNNKINLKGLDKIQIFRGRFHSTKSLSKNGIHVLEIESPEDKTDLVRLSDAYGREHLPYEDSTSYIPKPEGCLNLNIMPSIDFAGCKLEIKTITDKQELKNHEVDTVFVILEGGIQQGKSMICPPGDVIASHNLDILLEKFSIINPSLVLQVSKS
jgi:mannose-6-phosphate isomerase-like protein (cupin superfamily)